MGASAGGKRRSSSLSFRDGLGGESARHSSLDVRAFRKPEGARNKGRKEARLTLQRRTNLRIGQRGEFRSGQYDGDRGRRIVASKLTREKRKSWPFVSPIKRKRGERFAI